MDNITIEGLVIRVIHYNESSEIVHLFTQGGIVSVMCKGARRYKSHKLSFCIPMTYVKAIVTDSKIPTLIDYTIIDNYDFIKNDLKRNLWFSYLLEIINKLPNDTYYKNIFNMLKKLFEYGKTEDSLLLIMIAQTKLLKCYGVEPEFRKCVICGKNQLSFFSVSNGGFICNDHNVSDKEDINIWSQIKRLYYFDLYNGSLTDLSDIDLKSVFNRLSYYYSYHVEIKLHSLSSLII